MYIPYTPLLYVLKSRKCGRINELPQHLSAHTAWCSVSGLRKRIFVKFPAYDRDCRKFPAAFTHSLEDGCPLCTVSRCKCCVLNIASGVYLRICPSSAAPTAKCEYGAYENFRASAAIRIRFCIFFFSNFIYCLILYFVNYDSRYATPTLLSAGNQQPPSRHPLLCQSS